MPVVIAQGNLVTTSLVCSGRVQSRTVPGFHFYACSLMLEKTYGIPEPGNREARHGIGRDDKVLNLKADPIPSSD